MKLVFMFVALVFPLAGSYAETKPASERVNELLKKASKCQVLRETVAFRGSDAAKEVATAWIMNPQNLLNIQERIQSRIFFRQPLSVDLQSVEFSIHFMSSGRIVKAAKIRESGEKKWDAAVERAVWGSSPHELPAEVESFTLRCSP
jgi:hypothetical protein